VNPTPYTHRTHRTHRTADTAPEPPVVPVVLPLAVVTVNGTGALTVTVNDEPLLPPPFAPPWDRNSFATVIDAHRAAPLAEQRVDDRGERVAVPRRRERRW
jgi:hypothetical protein